MHTHFSRLRCRLVSWRDQSYLVRNESQQKVHGNGRRSVPDFDLRPVFVTRMRAFLERGLRIGADVVDRLEVVDLEEPFVSALCPLVVEVARPILALLLSRVSDEPMRGSASFKAPAIAASEAASASGGDSRHLCIGSSDVSLAVYGTGIGADLCPAARK